MLKSLKIIPVKIIILVFGVVSYFTFSSFSSKPYIPKSSDAAICDSVPALNKRIIDFVNTRINLKVGEGESWDFVAEALDSVGAKWNHEYKFGREIDLKKECAYPGDVIQLTKIKIEYHENHTFYREEIPNHTAIIYEVISQDHFILIEQNTGKLGMKVGTSPFEIKRLKAGKFKIYRPLKN